MMIVILADGAGHLGHSESALNTLSCLLFYRIDSKQNVQTEFKDYVVSWIDGA